MQLSNRLRTSTITREYTNTVEEEIIYNITVSTINTSATILRSKKQQGYCSIHAIPISKLQRQRDDKIWSEHNYNPISPTPHIATGEKLSLKELLGLGCIIEEQPQLFLVLWP